MLGWDSAATARASRSKRSRRSGVGGEVRVEDFQGDLALQTGIAGAIDFAHAAGAEERSDFVGAEAGPGG